MSSRGELARYPRPSVAVDVALFTVSDARLGVVLVQRDREPSRGAWALPGTILRIDETLDAAAERVLARRPACRATTSTSSEPLASSNVTRVGGSSASRTWRSRC